MLRIGMVTLLAILVAGLLAGASSAQAQAPPAPPQQPGVYGGPPAQQPAQTPTQGEPHRGRAWRTWWKRAKCGAAVVVVVGGTVFAAAKIAKIVGLIRKLGGVKNTAKLLVGATSRSEKMKVFRAAPGASLKGAMAAATYFLGIDTIKENC